MLQDSDSQEIFYDAVTISPNHSPAESPANSPTTTPILPSRKLSKPNRIAESFSSGLYSDISVIVYDETLYLHKVILLQSPVLVPKLKQSVLDLELQSTDISKLGVKIVLEILYQLEPRIGTSIGQYLHEIKKETVFLVLGASIFFDLQFLIDYCLEFIKTTLKSFECVVEFAVAVQGLKALSGSTKFVQRVEQCYLELSEFVFETILYCVSVAVDPCIVKEIDGSISISIQDETEDESNNEEEEPNVRQPVSKTQFIVPKADCKVAKDKFLAQFPLVWIEKAVVSDELCVQGEFDRYLLVKRILDLRHSGRVRIASVEAPAVVDISSEDDLEDVRLDDEPKSETVNKVTNSLLSYFDNLLPRKKRKLDEVEQSDKDVSNEKSPRPVIQPKKLKKRKEKKDGAQLPKTLNRILSKGIVYTYMTFQQLNVVKRDELVPMNIALESFWKQQELETCQGELPVFRFGCKFEGIVKEFWPTSGTGAVELSSNSYSCAGVLFRVILVKEGERLKALLQKSVGKQRVSYTIRMYDHSSRDTKIVTKCEDEKGFVEDFIIQSDADWVDFVVRVSFLSPNPKNKE